MNVANSRKPPDTIVNIYCDESGHLEHDETKVMVLGAVWCRLSRTHEMSIRLRENPSKTWSAHKSRDQVDGSVAVEAFILPGPR